MNRPPKIKLRPSTLLDKAWNVGMGTPIAFVNASSDDVILFQNSSNLTEYSWNWSHIWKTHHEVFAIKNPNGIFGMAASKPDRLLSLLDGSYYRVDWFMVAPRNKSLGVLLFSLLAARAVEAEADGIVLGAVPDAVGFFQHLGGQKLKIKGWECGRGLVAMTFRKDVLNRLSEAVHGSP